MQSNLKVSTDIAYFNKLKNEIEEKIYQDSNGNFIKGLFYTDRALMAQNNIILKETIGKGCYSKVKEGFDFKLMKKVAVKIIDCSKAPKDFQEKFLPREIEIWPKLNHDNIIKMFDYIIRDKKIYLILEHADGGDLLSFIQNLNAPMCESKAKIWIKQICEAVNYLHSQNIIHRDLKLENLLIHMSSNEIKICDFGFCKLVIPDYEDLSKTYCGSKAYASPEILLGQPYDPKKSDVWAIGVILFIFLNGNMPFKEDENNELILNQHKTLKLYWSRIAKISSKAKGLIKSIFTFEWENRPSIYQILNDKWLLNND